MCAMCHHAKHEYMHVQAINIIFGKYILIEEIQDLDSKNSTSRL